MTSWTFAFATVFCLLEVPTAAGLPPQTSPDSLDERLKAVAAQRPDVARLVEGLAQSREANSFDAGSFAEHVRVQMREYQLAPGGKYVQNLAGTSGEASIGSGVGSEIQWVDQSTGKTQSLSYEARSDFHPDTGLAVTVTTRPPDGPEKTSTYTFDNFGPLTIVLREIPGGSRYVVRFTPLLEPKPYVLDYADHLDIALDSAILVADGQLAGTYSCSGSIVGIGSPEAGMMFEFGLKPFADAKPIGRTDGRTIWFEHANHKYELHNSRLIASDCRGDAVRWTVYIRAEPYTDTHGHGSHSKSYGSQLLQEIMKESTGNK